MEVVYDEEATASVRLSPTKATEQLHLAHELVKLKARVAQEVTKDIQASTSKRDRIANALFGNFKLNTLRAAHLIATCVVWYHFFYNKMIRQENAVPEGAPHFWWKRNVPPIEFGLMHAILLQLTIIPLTMSRQILGALARTPLQKYIPFEHALAYHIFLGYVFCIEMVLAVILFFTFFGRICDAFNRGKDPADFCAKFTEEIMVTGYAIFVTVVIVLVTSFFRDRLPHEVFYVMHHIVFVMFALALIHTMDVEFRRDTKIGRDRSQTFKWFLTSLLIYITDRIWQHLSAFRGVPVKFVSESRDSSVLELCLYRPSGFTFKVGQHAFLQVPEIDPTYHPFSIASVPDSEDLRFIIEVKQQGSWTWRLLQLAEKAKIGALKVNVMGAFGTPLVDSLGYRNVLAIGTGTGVVPMLSLILERGSRLKLLKKEVFLEANRVEARNDVETVQLAHMVKDLDPAKARVTVTAIQCFQQIARLRSLRKYGQSSSFRRKIRRQAAIERGHELIHILAVGLLLFEFFVLCATLSWANLPMGMEATDEHGCILRWCMVISVGLYTCFFLYRMAVPYRFRRGVLNGLDLIVVVTSIFTLALWWHKEQNFREPDAYKQVLRTLLSVWRLGRLWFGQPVAAMPNTEMTMSRLMLGENKCTLIWACRSADLLASYASIFNKLLDELNTGMPTTSLRKLISIQIFCTDKDPVNRAMLRSCIKGTQLQDCVRFRRPDLSAIIHNTMGDQLMEALNGLEGGASSLVTFVGSPAVSAICSQHVQQANLRAKTLGFFNHMLFFRSETYSLVGGGRRKAQAGMARTSTMSTRSSSPKQDMSAKSKNSARSGSPRRLNLLTRSFQVDVEAPAPLQQERQEGGKSGTSLVAGDVTMSSI